MAGGRSQLQEDRRGRIILAPYVFCIRFKGSFCTCPQWLNLPKTSSQLRGIQEDLSTRKILSPHKLETRKILVPGAYQGNQSKMVAGRSVAGHGNKGRPFPLALPRTDYLREFTLNFRRLITSSRFYCLSYGGSKTNSK